MDITVTLGTIDYNSIVPLLKNSGNSAVKSLISVFLKGGISLLPQSLKDSAAVSFADHYRDNIITAVNRMLADKGIDARVDYYTAEKTPSGIVIRARAAAGWSGILDRFYPDIIARIPRKDSTAVVFDALDIIGGDRKDITDALIERLQTAEKLEPLIAMAANTYSKAICDALNKLIASSGVRITIAGLTVGAS